ncbi:MAG: phospholipid carrier-dependent glycosyltransferase [Rhodospirillales bacterium]|nr:phospholipid carrier-dependent glycosyltransferase [Rhodospirillales bacterium]
MDSSRPRASWIRDLLALTVLIGLLFGAFIGQRPLGVPSEARYAEIPREMVATGDWVTPRLNGVKYFEKPPLFYWIQAAAIEAFGTSEAALRFTTAGFGLLSCLLVYIGGRRLYSRAAGLLGAGVLATSLLHFGLSRVILLDMPVSFFISATLLAFLLAVRAPPGRERSVLLYLAYAMAAGAVLTKGLIGIVLPGLVVFVWLAVTGQWRLLREVHLPTGLLLFLVLAVPWHIMAGSRTPEFYWFYFVHEHFLRFVTKIHNRYQPPWFFIPIILLGFLPWVVFLGQATGRAVAEAWRDRRRHQNEMFLLLWVLLIFAFFSASDSKLIPYILPVFPPLAIFIGRYLADGFADAVVPRGMRAGFTAFAGLWSALAIAALAVLAFPERLIGAENAGEMHVAGWLVPATAGSLVLGAAAAIVVVRRGGLIASLVVMFVAAVSVNLLGDALVGRYQLRSIKPLAEILNQRLKPGDEVVTYRNYHQDLPVYIGRTVTIVEWTGELEFGTTIEDTSGWMIEDATFWERWRGPKTVYMIVPPWRFDGLRADPTNRIYEVARTERFVLAVNRDDPK